MRRGYLPTMVHGGTQTGSMKETREEMAIKSCKPRTRQASVINDSWVKLK